MSESWAEEPTPPPPFDFGNLNPETVEQVVPDYRASSNVQDEPRKRTFKEALNARRDKNTVRDTREKIRKIVPNKPGQFIEPLTDFYNTVAMLVMPFKPEVAFAITGPAHPPTEEVPNPLTVGENCAKAWDEAAQRSERIRNMLNSFLTAGVLGTLIAAHIPIIATAFPSRFNPGAAMEEMLKRYSESQE